MKPEDVSQEAALKLAEEIDMLSINDKAEAISRAITAAVAAEREACAVVADDIAAGRSRQKMEATTFKRKTEARDFESMAMAAIDVSYNIRARSVPC